MKPTLRLQSIDSRAAADIKVNLRDVSALAERRQQAVRALDQTRDARNTGEIEQAAAAAVNEIENQFTGIPEPGPSGVVIARVVASGDSKTGLPAIPLAGLTVRVKVSDKIIDEGETNAFGLVALNLPKEEQGSYEIDVLGPAGKVLVVQKGRWESKQPSPVHRIELARSDELKPQLERGAKIETAIRTARERAALVREVVVKALQEQETRLVEYVGEIDEALECEPCEETEAAGNPLQQLPPEQEPQVTPAKTAPALTEDKNAGESIPDVTPKDQKSATKQRRAEKTKKSK